MTKAPVLDPVELAVPKAMSGTTGDFIEGQNQQILDAVEKRLREAEKGKTYRDTKERKRGTQKEMRAFNIINAQVLDDLEDDPVMARKLVVKQKVWPEGIDPEIEKSKGVSAGAAFLKDKVYKLLAKQPYDSKDARETYVRFIDVLKASLEDVKTVDDVRSVLDAFDKPNIYSLFIGDLSDDEIYKLTKKHIYRYSSDYSRVKAKMEGIIGKSLLSYIYTKTDAAYATFREAELYEVFTAEQKRDYIERQLITLDKAKANILEKAKEFADWDDKKLLQRYIATWTVSKERAKQHLQMEGGSAFVRSRVDGTYRLEQIEKTIAELKRGEVAKRFEVRPNDWSWVGKQVRATKESSSEATIIINTKPALSHVSRKGGVKVPFIAGSQIASMYSSQLGIDAVQFGNSLPDDEREKHANFTFASFRDLEEVIGVSIKSLNQIRKLGMDFATRGQKGSAATYWSDYGVINLNRRNGDGTLAHEWAHYLDNALSKSTGDKMKINGKEGRFATMGGSPDEVITDILNKWWASAIGSDRDVEIDVDFYATDTVKISIYYFKDTVEDTIKYFLGKRGYNLWHPKTLKDLNRVYGSIAKHFGLGKVTVKLRSEFSNFYRHSMNMDFGKSRQYWSSRVEMFARSFEMYVLDRYEAIGIRNNYLQSDNRWAASFGVYPVGDEKRLINLQFDRLFDYLRSRYPVTYDYANAPRITDEQVHEGLSDQKKQESKKSDMLSIKKKKLALKAKSIRIRLRLNKGMEGMDIQPNKSVSASQTQAIKDVLSLKKYEKYNQRTAALLFKVYRDDLNYQYETDSEYEQALLDKVSFELVESSMAPNNFSSDVWELTDLGRELVTAIKARHESLRNVKSGSSLFPEDVTKKLPDTDRPPASSSNIKRKKLALKARAIRIRLKLNDSPVSDNDTTTSDNIPILELYSDAKASKDRFGITDADGNPLWYGRFFDSDLDYNGEQSSGELAAASKAVWFATKVKETAKLDTLKLILNVDAQWLTYQDHPKQKGFKLTRLANKYGLELEVKWIPGTQNPADQWTVSAGYKKWSDNDLPSLISQKLSGMGSLGRPCGNYSAKEQASYEKERTSVILQQKNKWWPYHMPQELIDEIRTWKVIDKSPYSWSIYNTGCKDWHYTPDGSLRVSDHWNFHSRGTLHAPTDKEVKNNEQWALARWNDYKGLYEVLKIWDNDIDKARKLYAIDEEERKEEQRRQNEFERQLKVNLALFIEAVGKKKYKFKNPLKPTNNELKDYASSVLLKKAPNIEIEKGIYSGSGRNIRRIGSEIIKGKLTAFTKNSLTTKGVTGQTASFVGKNEKIYYDLHRIATQGAISNLWKESLDLIEKYKK